MQLEAFMKNLMDQAVQDRKYAYRTGMLWSDWRSQVKAHFQKRLGAVPTKKAELQPEVLERTSFDGYIRERIEITTYEGMRMPIYLLIPKEADVTSADATQSAVIAVHGHGYGSREIVGIEPDGSERKNTPGLHKDFAVELVKEGHIVAAPELFGFGDRRLQAELTADDPKKSSCAFLSAQLMSIGQTIAGFRVYETQRVVDYLQSRSDVDSQRIGIMGISGGGLVAGFTAAIDERISSAVISGYASTFTDSVLSRLHCLDNYIPGILQDAEMPDLLGLIAPRGLFIESGDNDRVFPQQFARKAYGQLQDIYEAAQSPENLEADFFQGGHEIHGIHAYAWLHEQLKK